MIIGLLVGGILAGGTLVQQARLNKIRAQTEEYSLAINAFMGKYNALPGDMYNVTTYLSGTSNGNGSGVVGEISGCTISTYMLEPALFWQHLSLAGFIRGSYSGAVGTVIGTDMPAGSIGKTIYHIQNLSGCNGGYGTANSGYETGSPYLYKSVLGIGSPYETGGALFPTQGFLTAKDAWSIDLKYDDGKPFSGKILTHDAVSITCGLAATNTYNITVDGKLCNLFFHIIPEM